MADYRVRSQQFRLLEKQLRQLKKHFLPQKFSPTGSYPDKVFYQVLAYRVLCHAEFETYVEERVKELSIKSVQVLKNKRKITPVISCLVAFSGKEMELPPESKSPFNENQKKNWPSKLKLDEKVKSTVSSFLYVITQNHGIKEKNILSLLLPIGIDSDEIDDTWLATLNSFAEERGQVAHLSSSTITRLPDPKDEYDRVNSLLAGFKKLDESLNKLLP